MAQQKVHVVVFKDAESDQWVAMCLEYDVVTQGDDEEHAKTMLKEAVELHLGDMSNEDIEVLYQPVQGEPKLHLISIDAPTLLHS